jgi:hypothetical protein
MADFKTQIDNLTGFGSTDDVALADWLLSGAREVIDVLPMSKLDRMSEIQEFTNFQGVEDSKILHVLRKDENNSNILMPCREIHASESGRATDSSYMEFATSSDPVYYLENKRIYTLPASASSNDSKLIKINEDFTINIATDTIDNFPKEATNAVVLYASRNAVMRLMNDLQTNNDITTAFTATNTELDETQAVCDLLNTRVDTAITNISNAATEIGLAKTEAAEIASQTDNGGGFATALTALSAAVDKIQAASGDPALFGDEDIYTTGVGFTKVKDALDNATNLINNNQPSATTDAFGAQAEEDVELVQSALNIAQTEQNRARIHLEEFVTSINGLKAEIDGYNQEVNARATFTSAKGQAVQAYINTASAYINEASANLAVASGYGNEITAKINISNAYLSEANSRLNRDQAKYQWYTQQYEMLDAKFQESLQLISIDKIDLHNRNNHNQNRG